MVEKINRWALECIKDIEKRNSRGFQFWIILLFLCRWKRRRKTFMFFDELDSGKHKWKNKEDIIRGNKAKN